MMYSWAVSLDLHLCLGTITNTMQLGNSIWNTSKQVLEHVLHTFVCFPLINILSSWEIHIQIWMERSWLSQNSQIWVFVQRICQTKFKMRLNGKLSSFHKLKQQWIDCVCTYINIIIIPFYSMPFIASRSIQINVKTLQNIYKSNMNTPFAWPISNYNNNEI